MRDRKYKTLILTLGLLTILFFGNTSFAGPEWYWGDKCTPSTDITPDSLLEGSSIAKCKEVSRSNDGVKLSCESSWKAFNGELVFYRTNEACVKSGGQDPTASSDKIRMRVNKMAKQKMWFKMKSTCPVQKVSNCEKSDHPAKNLISNITDKLLGTGYSCSDTFTMAKDQRVLASIPMFQHPQSLCVRDSDLCSVSLHLFETKNECELFTK